MTRVHLLSIVTDAVYKLFQLYVIILEALRTRLVGFAGHFASIMQLSASWALSYQGLSLLLLAVLESLLLILTSMGASELFFSALFPDRRHRLPTQMFTSWASTPAGELSHTAVSYPQVQPFWSDPSLYLILMPPWATSSGKCSQGRWDPAD